MSITHRVRRFVFLFLLCIVFGQLASAQCSSSACLDTAQNLKLPSGPLSQLSSPGLNVALPFYSDLTVQFTATFTGVPAGLSITNTTYLAWCFDVNGDFNKNDASTPYTAYSSYSPSLPANVQSPNWDKVNWVLNNKPSGSQSTWAVQQVIWRLMSGSYVNLPGYPLPQPATDDLYNQAIALGSGFVPAAGQTVAVVLYVDGQGLGTSNFYQDIVMEVPMPNCGKLGDFVFSDLNSNGVQEAGEPGINGVTVRLLDMANHVLQTTVTSTFMGQDGYYQFTNLACGTPYQVQVDTASPPLAGKQASPVNGTPNTALDSNPNPATVIIPPSGSDQTIDFGFYTPIPCTGSIGDFVFNDANRNGIQDLPAELGISSVLVTLNGPGGLSLSMPTDGSGKYLFTGLCSGSYTVSVAPPANYTATTPNAPGSTTANDSNPSPASVVLPSNNSNDLTIDFGFYPTCNSAIGDFVFTDLNGNGIQDAGEEGINGVTLNLLDSSGNILKSTTTQQLNGLNGSYTFTGVCAGNYQVVVTGGVPSGYTPSPVSAPGSNPANDSNGSPANVVLPQNTTDNTIDFGFVPPCTGTIGDLVFTDANANGIQDSGDTGIPNVVVNLRKASDNSILQTTTTLADGTYLFTGVCTGDYKVEVVPPTGVVPSPTGQGTPQTDSNPNPSPVTLPTNNSTDKTIDFGFYPLPTATCVLINAVQGIAITPVTMTASGGAGAPYTFSATGLPNGLVMAADGTISGTATVTGTFNYAVTIKDKNGNAGTINCSVTVNPAVTATCVLINAIQGIAITPVTMTASGGAGGPYTFSATGLPNGLVMAPNGTISGTATVSGTFSYTVTIKDKDGNIGTFNCSVTVNPAVTATCVLINAVQGIAITPVTMTASGGAGGPYTFSATGLPNGLVMAANGTISGTATVSGTFNYTVTVKDKEGNIGTFNCSVTVKPPVAATCVLINAVQGSPFSVKLTGSGGNGGPYTFSKTGGPVWLNVAADGTVSGTPTATGTFTYSVQIRDKDGNIGTLNCSVTVLTTPTASCVLINAVQGTPFSVKLTGSGGTGGPYVFSKTAGPTWLSVAADGTISGTPTATGTFTYSVQIKDKDGNVGTFNCSVTVNPPPVVCVPGTFTLTGNTSTSGTAGIIRTFTATNGTQVKVSAFSRNKSTGAWSTAYLGSYSAGVGVTDRTEGSGPDPLHKVDNVGQEINYVMFEFSGPVVVNRAYLNSVSGDSDITAWIGSKSDPFNNHLTLSDSLLASLSKSDNDTTLTTARWADINNTDIQGNVLVIASSTSDTTPDDQFKISQIETSCPNTQTCSGRIGDFVWKDLNSNGIQDAGEPGVSGVSLQLKSGTTVLKSTTTTSTGSYEFAGLCAGSYTVSIPTLPTGYTASPGLAGSNRGVDSNANPTAVTLSTNASVDTTLDFGLVKQTSACVIGTFTTTGSTSTTGSAGNIRTFTASNGVQVKVSAFSRTKADGDWSTAYLGAYSSGLGVTDRSESGADPTHKVDNVGTRDNYVLFEFSSPVIINRAYLDAVGVDSDVTAWIGSANNPFSNHLTLSDSLLQSFGPAEENTTSVTGARWADINAVGEQGNVLVIAARINDSSKADEFKLTKLETACK